MELRRLVRPEAPVAVHLLAIMASMSGAGSLAWAAFPLAQDAPRGLLISLGALGVAVAVALVLGGRRVAPRHLHVTVALLITMTGLKMTVAVTERGLLLSALSYMWIAVYVAFFFPPRAARSYAALMTAMLGGSLLVTRAPTSVAVWVTISTMVWVAVPVLAKLNAGLRAQAHTDSLTGLLNRAGFASAATHQRALAARRDLALTLVMIDLDNFKVVNDRDGHHAGDRLLVALAQAWTAALRAGDLVARFGGDEFVLILSGTTGGQVDEVLARLARAHPASWTAGAVLWREAESLEDAITRADAHLYAAKESRRQGSDQVARVTWVNHPMRPTSHAVT